MATSAGLSPTTASTAANSWNDDVLVDFDWLAGHEVRLEIEGPIDPRLMAIMCGLEGAYDVAEQRRNYNRDEPVALDDRDPSNADVEALVAPLAPDDNVFTLVHPDEDTLREFRPVGETSAD